MPLIDYIHPEDQGYELKGASALKIPIYLIKIINTRKPHREWQALATLHPEIVWSVEHDEYYITVERLEEIYGSWTFEDELEAIDERGW